ncbi:efflux transporter outer membrane subunit [Chitinophaga solisilvae]|uniref:efflux transporter outer membrane subunit n=1 Tax=Chitinophaga solisilvae TaxID=1233460 RepID=UPI00136F8F56|nr:efflux transporter outer membrane subunit [Chitinophaga solisilvae]
MKEKISLILVMAVICVTTACRVGKDFTRPAVALPDKYRGAGAATDTTSIAGIPWKSFFTDPVLQTLIDSAIAKNFDMLTALKNVEAAERSVRASRLGNLPDINLTVQGNRNWPSKNSLNGSLSQEFIGTRFMDDYNANVGLSWEVIAWGKISRLKEAALADYLRSAEASKAVQTKLVSDVAQGYYNLLMLDNQLEITKKNLALNDSTLRIMRLQYESGQTNTLAIEQTEAQRDAAAALLPKIEQQISQQENALRLLTGDLPGSIARQANLQSVRFDGQLSAGVPAALLSARPDVHAAEMSVMAANARTGVARANMYPALNITASAGLNAFKASSWFSIPGSLFETVGGSITQPVFQRRKLKTEWETAKIEWEKSVISFRQSVLTAVGEVSDALVKIDKLKAQYSITQQRVQKLESATRNASMLYQNGMANYLEVITAQGNVLQSELDLAAIQREQLGAVTELYRALGGGWK